MMYQKSPMGYAIIPLVINASSRRKKGRPWVCCYGFVFLAQCFFLIAVSWRKVVVSAENSVKKGCFWPGGNGEK